MPFVSRERLLARATLEPNKEARQKLLHQIFDGYKASSDWPGHQFADDLMDMYPNAKIILNKRRTPEEWEKEKATKGGVDGPPMDGTVGGKVDGLKE